MTDPKIENSCTCAFCQNNSFAYGCPNKISKLCIGLVQEVNVENKEIKGLSDILKLEPIKYNPKKLTYEMLDECLKNLNESLKRQHPPHFVVGYYCLTNGYQTTDNIPCNNPKCTCNHFKIKLKDIK